MADSLHCSERLNNHTSRKFSLGSFVYQYATKCYFYSFGRCGDGKLTHKPLNKNLLPPVTMKRIPMYLLILGLLLPACSNRSGGRTTMVVKPKNHHWWFNKKKDKGKKRTKMVKMRS